MKNFNLFDFINGTVTIQSIINRRNSPKEHLTYFKVTLEESYEVIKLSISSVNASKIQVGTIIAYTTEDLAVGNSLWKNGCEPFYVVTKSVVP